MKKRLISLLCTATLLISPMLVSNVSAATGNNGKTILEPGLVDDLSTYDTSVDWNAGSYYAKPSQNPVSTKPALWVSDYLTNSAAPQIKGLFTDYWNSNTPMTKFLTPYDYTEDFERSLSYNVQGGSYLGFSYFLSNYYSITTLREIIFDNNNTGFQVWSSPDNGTSWSKMDKNSLLKFEIEKKLNPWLTYGGWPSSSGDFFDFIKNNDGGWYASDIFYYLQVGCSVKLPDNATMVKIVLPTKDTLLTYNKTANADPKYNGWTYSDDDFLYKVSLVFGAAKASKAPITAFSKGDAYDGTPSTGQNGKYILKPGMVDNLSTVKFDGDSWSNGLSTDYGRSTTNNGISGIWQSRYFGRTDALSAEKNMFTDYFSNDALMTNTNLISSFRTGESQPNDFERAMAYNVQGGSYFNFSYFLNSSNKLSAMKEMIFDDNGQGVQVWTSSDNAATWTKMTNTDLMKYEIGRKRSWDMASRNWLSNDGESIFEFLKNTNAESLNWAPNEIMSIYQVGCSVKLPTGATMAKIVFPKYETLVKDYASPSDEYIRDCFILGSVSADDNVNLSVNIVGEDLRVNLLNVKGYEQYQIWAYENIQNAFKVSQPVAVLKKDYNDPAVDWSDTASKYLRGTEKYCVFIKIKTGNNVRILYCDRYVAGNSIYSSVEPMSNNRIQSNDYNVYRYVMSRVNSGTTVADFKTRMHNSTDDLKVFNGDTEVTEGYIKTGMTVKLTQNGVLTDSVKIAVTGDIYGDGTITISDLIAAKKILLGVSSFNSEQYFAADVNFADGTTIADLVLYKKYLLKVL